MNPVEFNDIHRAYERGVNVLDGVSFSIGAGQVVGLVGKNGTGKTTLIRIAMGMLAALRGTVRLFGMDPRRRPLEVKRRVGHVSEDQVLPPFLRVDEVIELHRGLFPTWDDAMTRQLVERFELPLHARIKTLSKGQARQVALLCAICHRPELLILDEPAGGLDPATRREFLETSIRLLNETGSTILFSSHYMTDVERLADRIVMLHDGKVLIDSQLDDLHEQYALALVPHDCGVTREQLLTTDTCVAVRERSDAQHAIFRLEPGAAATLLERQLGVAGARCASLPLEELFIELAGGQS